MPLSVMGVTLTKHLASKELPGWELFDLVFGPLELVSV